MIPGKTIFFNKVQQVGTGVGVCATGASVCISVCVLACVSSCYYGIPMPFRSQLRHILDSYCCPFEGHSVLCFGSFRVTLFSLRDTLALDSFNFFRNFLWKPYFFGKDRTLLNKGLGLNEQSQGEARLMKSVH